MTPEPTVFVVDDDRAVRESLRWLIQSVDLAVETFSRAQAFLDSYDPSRPGCLVLDVRMPGLSGLELQAKLAARNITLPVIIITGHADVPMAIRGMKQGAVDFIEKPFSDEVLLDRIRHSIELDSRNRLRREEQAEIASRAACLTPREREIMRMVVSGRANKVIAHKLGVSHKTIEVHRASVMTKMQADSLADLVRMSMILDPAPQGKP